MDERNSKISSLIQNDIEDDDTISSQNSIVKQKQSINSFDKQIEIQDKTGKCNKIGTFFKMISLGKILN